LIDLQDGAMESGERLENVASAPIDRSGGRNHVWYVHAGAAGSPHHDLEKLIMDNAKEMEEEDNVLPLTVNQVGLCSTEPPKQSIDGG
jgi:hypothetical protein